jgi:enoyl-CoA hydratase
MDNYQTLNVDVQEHVAILTISRPEALNALNSLFFDEMESFLGKLATQPDIRLLVITGEGKAFVAGADIAEMADMTQSEGLAFSKRGQMIFRMIEELEIPVIAAVNGFALGGGCELAMSCDIRVASAKAKFGQPEVNLGLTPGYAGTQRLSRLVGKGDAMLMLLSGDHISAEDALRIGLVQWVAEPEELMEKALDLAKKIVSKGPLAVKKVKKAVRIGLESTFEKGCDLESQEFSSLFEGEGKEGMKAFLEKRPPKW